jgi:antitoxin component YwqK of YwqJK toxin-antitoxin module
MSDYLVALVEHFRKKYPEGKYLYKSCSTVNDSWIVVLQLTNGSVTNQVRLSYDNPNRKYSKFRASELKVIDIVNKFDKTKKIDSVTSSSNHASKIKYVKSTVVLPDSFDSNLDKVCSNGIHFFESIQAAFYYELDGLQNYSGHWIRWDNDGQKSSEGNYLDGKRTGHWTWWYENGQKDVEGHYLNGKTHGHWISWYSNGRKFSDGHYLNGEKSGCWIYWYENGKKMEERHYEEGVLTSNPKKWKS